MPAELDDFVDKFRILYGHNDKGRTEESLWLQVVEEGSSVAEAVRELKHGEALSHLTDLFVWFCGFIAKCNDASKVFHVGESLSTILWLKYPSKCPRCNGNPCKCLTLMPELIKREKKQKEESYDNAEQDARRRLSSRVRKLDDVEVMFEELYESNIMVTSVTEIAFHLVEEIGEVSEQIRELRTIETRPSLNGGRVMVPQREMRRELADVFSWLISLIIKLNNLAEGSVPSIKVLSELGEGKIEWNTKKRTPRKPLLRALVLKYYSKGENLVCRSCGKKRCDLSFHLKRNRLYPVNEPQNSES